MRDHYGKLVFDSVDEVLDPRHCALIVIDMQNDLMSEQGAYASVGEDVTPMRGVIDPIRTLIEAARGSQVPIIYTMNVTLANGRSDSPAWAYFKNYSRPGLNGAYTIEGTWGAEIISEVRPAASDLIVRKHRSDAFVGTDLEIMLRALEVTTVVTCGIVTNGCVESTARHAAFLDFCSVVVEDAVASSSHELHEAALTVLRARHDVVPSGLVIKRWESENE